MQQRRGLCFLHSGHLEVFVDDWNELHISFLDYKTTIVEISQHLVRSPHKLRIDLLKAAQELVGDRATVDWHLILTTDQKEILLNSVHQILVGETNLVLLAGLQVKPLNHKQQSCVLSWLEYPPVDLIIVNLAINDLVREVWLQSTLLKWCVYSIELLPFGLKGSAGGASVTKHV